ncbi:MAG: periplasmic heavy metal sensor [Deltaproteobacteria bacterium]|jgi:zinc resistance-associated protein|nr:periplasmic heavy metal sensor [Deltaproteobacteria bacterium]
MKKFLAAAALIGAIGITGISMASPQSYYGCGNYGGPRDCDNLGYSENEKISSFYEETKELRREIIVKRSELDALMRQDNPDEKKVAKLTGDIYDLRAELEEKADKTFEGGTDYGRGPGFGYCGGGRRTW